VLALGGLAWLNRSVLKAVHMQLSPAKALPPSPGRLPVLRQAAIPHVSRYSVNINSSANRKAQE
jgi:hypothetical protein